MQGTSCHVQCASHGHTLHSYGSDHISVCMAPCHGSGSTAKVNCLHSYHQSTYANRDQGAPTHCTFMHGHEHEPRVSFLVSRQSSKQPIGQAGSQMANYPELRERAMTRLTNIHHVYTREERPRCNESSIHQLFRYAIERACIALGKRPATTEQRQQYCHSFRIAALPPLPPPSEPPPLLLPGAAEPVVPNVLPAQTPEEQDAHWHTKHYLELAAILHVLTSCTHLRLDILLEQLKDDHAQADTTLSAYQEIPHEVHEAMQTRFGVAKHAVAVAMVEVLMQLEQGLILQDFAPTVDRDHELRTGAMALQEQWKQPPQNLGLRGYMAQRQQQTRQPSRVSPYPH